MKYLLTLLLLCGATQAHGPDDWCVGRVDTTWSDILYHRTSIRWVAYPGLPYVLSVDTTWVLCPPKKPKRNYDIHPKHPDSMRWGGRSIHRRLLNAGDWCAVVDTLSSHPHRRPETPCGNACIPVLRADTTWVRCSSRMVNPERWYIKSVDTTDWYVVVDMLTSGYGKACDFQRYDTTWAKKIPLSEVWLTPREMVMFRMWIWRPAKNK